MRIIAIAFAGVFALVSAAQAQVLTLEEALATADNPALAAGQARVTAADARLDQARAQRLPHMSARGQYGRAETDFGGGRLAIEPRSAMIGAEQLIFSGGRVSAAIRQARSGLRAREAEFAGIRAAMIADIAEAYLGALNSRRALAFHAANLTALSTLADQARLRFEAGEIPRSEVSQAEARRAIAEAMMAQARADDEAARSRFFRVTGLVAEELAAVAGPPSTTASREEAITRAQAASPLLIALREAEEAAEAGVSQARSQYAPTIGIGVEASTVRDEFLPGYQAEGVAVFARLSIPIFTGGRLNAEVREARAELDEARALRLAAERAVVDDVTQAFENHRAAQIGEDAARLQVDASQSARDSIADEVQVGSHPLIDLLDAERDLLDARLTLDRAHAAAIASAYRLNALIGAPPAD